MELFFGGGRHLSFPAAMTTRIKERRGEKGRNVTQRRSFMHAECRQKNTRKKVVWCKAGQVEKKWERNPGEIEVLQTLATFSGT